MSALTSASLCLSALSPPRAVLCLPVLCHVSGALWLRAPACACLPRLAPALRCCCCGGQVVEYFHYKVRYSHSSEMPEFKIEPEIALELLMASNFLDT